MSTEGQCYMWPIRVTREDIKGRKLYNFKIMEKRIREIRAHSWGTTFSMRNVPLDLLELFPS